MLVCSMADQNIGSNPNHGKPSGHEAPHGEAHLQSPHGGSPSHVGGSPSHGGGSTQSTHGGTPSHGGGPPPHVGSNGGFSQHG